MDKYAINFKNALSGIKQMFFGGEKTIMKTKEEADKLKKLVPVVEQTKGLFNEPNLLKGFYLASGLGAGAVFMEALNKIVSEQYHIYKSKEYYAEMLKEHPQLKQFPPEDVAKYFKSLNHFAPHVASDPLAAGAYLTQSLKKLSGEELGGPPPDTYNTLADIQKKVIDAKNSKNKDGIFGTFVTKALSNAMGGD
jgi:hypothetical protein